MVANLCGDLIFVHTCGDISFIHTCEDSIIFVLTCKDIIFNSNFVPHHVTAYKFGGVCLKHLWISFESLWQSLVIFRIFRKCLKIFGKCLETFVWPSDKFWKVLRNFWKVVGSFRKIAKKRYVFWHFVTFNKKTITWSLGDLNFLFSFWKNISLVHCTHLNKWVINRRVFLKYVHFDRRGLSTETWEANAVIHGQQRTKYQWITVLYVSNEKNFWDLRPDTWHVHA